MKKYASRTSRLTKDMVEESKELIQALGLPVIQAPSEGEAQAALIVNKGDAFGSISQDFDSLLFGAKYLIRNLSISSKRKVPGSSMYKEVPIEFYEIDKILEALKITQYELIIIVILCGTDFNPGGIKGIGPKKALKIIKEYKDRWDELFKILDWHSYFDYTWVEVFNTFKKMPTSDEVVEFKEIDKSKVKEVLMEKDFEETMLDRSLNGIKNVKTLDKFF